MVRLSGYNIYQPTAYWWPEWFPLNKYPYELKGKTMVYTPPCFAFTFEPPRHHVRALSTPDFTVIPCGIMAENHMYRGTSYLHISGVEDYCWRSPKESLGLESQCARMKVTTQGAWEPCISCSRIRLICYTVKAFFWGVIYRWRISLAENDGSRSWQDIVTREAIAVSSKGYHRLTEDWLRIRIKRSW